mmetsp:Transcript_65512/g.147821  ORF Transcript_65512/g.147821 Transcript_65512/m.147821 type:complete len:233 (-) Transcript_65512:173-871(-)|eukprot:CAMPEP_0172615536 /NCGR_PEP_ID=MMETSP1068-20121228/60474_1 /TAXON_ID=35684 /ORGANISM="Pseudopedinella elastica, Strain CCMP716" /LENGTH=232 /DNA_ID=CAMNT_0013420715 /DNA_START=33 /DNA_END=731 /DNA_ORIENTATION=+
MLRIHRVGAPVLRAQHRRVPAVFSSTLSEKFEEHKDTLRTAGIWGGGGVMVFGLSKGMYNITTGFMSMTPWDMGQYGFMAGFCTAGIVGTGSYWLSRSRKISADAVYRSTLKVLNNSAEVGQKLGGGLGGAVISEGLRAYKIDGGSYSIVGGGLKWVPHRIEMIFDVKGEMYDGLAIVEASQATDGPKTSFIAVDVMNSKGDKILVQGDPDRLKAETEIRKLVTYKTDHTKK